MEHIFTAAQRLPKLPLRDSIPEAELPDFDYMVARIKMGFGPTTEQVDGEQYGVAHFTALAVAPPLAKAVSQLGFAVMSRQDKPGSFTQADHEMIDMVLPLDSGYWAFLPGHIPAAIAGGIRIEAIEALRNAREDLLNTEERLQVDFIRAVRDGAMTDDLWRRMRVRLGTERGVVEYLYLICLLIFHHKFCWAVGAPEMTREHFEKMLNEYKTGIRKVPSRYVAPAPISAGE